MGRISVSQPANLLIRSSFVIEGVGLAFMGGAIPLYLGKQEFKDTLCGMRSVPLPQILPGSWLAAVGPMDLPTTSDVGR